MRSRSRGTVRLVSADPASPPEIRFNYMSHPDDWIDMRSCVRLTREIFAQPAFDPYRGAELAPGGAVQSDAEIDAFVRATVQSAYHPTGTCKMGTDAMAVVDPSNRVHGMEGLRVVDSSVMPRIATGNLNAPTRDDRGEGGRRDPRARAAAAVGRAGLCGARVGTHPTLNGFAAQFREFAHQRLVIPRQIVDLVFQSNELFFEPSEHVFEPAVQAEQEHGEGSPRRQQRPRLPRAW